MAMGRRKREQQTPLFVTASELPKSNGHPFYVRLNRLLASVKFDDWVEDLCRPCYDARPIGRPSIPPGVYFRMLFVGYFEGLESQREIAWRCADSLSLREFLGVPLQERTPDHSTLSLIRQRLPLEVFEQVFEFVLQAAAERKLLGGQTVGVDSTTLAANAAMKSIIRRDTGEDWRAYVRRLMVESGEISPDDDPSDEDLRRFDKNRKDKKVSNEEWVSKSDPEAQITQMKDGTTHLAYKAEHVVDLASNLIVEAAVYRGAHADMQTLPQSVAEAQRRLDNLRHEPEIAEVAADKGYHSAESLEFCQRLGVRTYIPERRSKHPVTWADKTESQRRAAFHNRRRVQRAKSKQYQRPRSERCERSFAHVCDTGGMRRSWLRGLVNVTKRYLMAAAAHNLGLILKTLFGSGKPREWADVGADGALCAAWATLLALRSRLNRRHASLTSSLPRSWASA